MQICADSAEKRQEWVDMIEALVTTAVADVVEETAEEVNSDWVALEHPDDGSTYYWNQVTDETSWEEPEDYAAPSTTTPAPTPAAAAPPPGTYVLPEGTTLMAEDGFKKQGGIRKNWKLRWWRLLRGVDGCRLEYWNNKKDAKTLGIIPIISTTRIKVS